MGFKGGFSAFVDGYQRSSEAAANRARQESQDKRVEEQAQYQRTRDAAQDKRQATDDAFRDEGRVRERKDWAIKDNLQKVEDDFRASQNAPVEAPPVNTVAPANTSADFSSSGPSLSSPSMSALLDKVASVPTASGLSGYDSEMALAKKLASAAGGYGRSQEIIAKAKNLKSEGVLETLNHLEANDPKAAWEAFNGSGAMRMPAGSKFIQDGKGKDPLTGVEKPTWKLVGQDGAVINPDVRGSVYASVFSPADRIKLESSRTNNDAKLELAKEKLEQAKFIAQMRFAAHGSGAAGQQPTAGFDSLHGFDPKEAQSAATKLVDEAIAGSGNPMTPQQRADAIANKAFSLRDAYAQNNGQREKIRVFRAEAGKARTPQEISRVRAEALTKGYTDADMASIDPRFAVQAQPTTAPVAPVAKRPMTAADMAALANGQRSVAANPRIAN